MEKTDAAVAAFLTQLQAISMQYGSDAVAGVLAAVHFNGVFYIIVGFLFLFFAFILLLAGLYFMRCALGVDEKYVHNYKFDRRDGWFLVMTITFAASVICLIPAIINVSQVSNWMAVFDPKMALAAKILNL